jgi:hypothetical protein
MAILTSPLLQQQKGSSIINFLEVSCSQLSNYLFFVVCWQAGEKKMHVRLHINAH